MRGRLQRLPDALEFSLQSLQILPRGFERALGIVPLLRQPVSFLRQPAALLGDRAFDVLTLRREIVPPPALGIELRDPLLDGGAVLVRAAPLRGEFLLYPRALARRLLLPLRPPNGGFLLETSVFCGGLRFET